MELEKIKKSIQDAGILIGEYQNLFLEFSDSDKVERVLPRTLTLSQKIDAFLSGDPYVALAILEDSQIPFWDIDENYGGS